MMSIARNVRLMKQARIAAARVTTIHQQSFFRFAAISAVTSMVNSSPSKQSFREYCSSKISCAETMSFQAETRKLLDIVTNSIYTDKEVFLRELVSNASDALEKFRYCQVKGSTRTPSEGSAAAALSISITTDETNRTVTIIDNGIGMTKEELVSNLGTIARSGSKQFVEDHLRSSPNNNNNNSSETNPDPTSTSASNEGIIGQFGVGFYSAFMVAENVIVESVSALGDVSRAHRWTSTGLGDFTIEEIDSIEGTV
jgi:HSP90 family molecular chaperone